MKAKGRILNKILGFVLVFVMVQGLIPVPARAAASKTLTVEGLTYTITVQSATDRHGQDVTDEIPSIVVAVNSYSRNGNQVSFTAYITSHLANAVYTFTDVACTEELNTTVSHSKSGNSVVLAITRDKASHTEGTCISPACTRCGASLDAPHDYKWVASEGQHWQVCSRDSSHVTAKEACSGGTAYCQQPALCSTCQNPYGVTDADNHLWETYDHTLSTGEVIQKEWNYINRDEHSKACALCGEEVVESHSFLRPPTCVHESICTGCSIIMTNDDHSWKSDWVYNDTEHWKVCSHDSDHTKDRGYHSGDSSANCATAGTCTTCGASYKNANAHSFTVTRSAADTLLQTCANGCGHSAAARVTAEDAVYTGSAITNTSDIAYSGDEWAGEKPVLSFEDNTHVGDAAATISAGGVTASATFKIDPADISGAAITLTPANGEYTGSAYDPAVTVVLDGFGTLVKDRDYSLSWDKTGFTNADTYTASITGKGNFEGTGEAVFHIGHASLSDVQVKQLGTLTYNGQKQTPAVSASAVSVNNQPVTFTYYDPDPNRSDWFETVPGFTNAGTYDVMYKAIAPNHNQYSNGFTVTITQATNEWVTTPSIDGWTYGGAASTPAGEAKFGTVSIWYSGTARDGTAWNSGTAPTKAGDYTATFTVDETGNYSGLEKSVDFTIAKADYDMSGAAWDYTGAFKHDGTEHRVEVGGLPAGVSVSGYSGNSASGIGKYSASVTLAYDEMNYNKPVFAYDLEWEIKQDWSQTENIGNVGGITSENVRPDDKDDLESAREDLEKALENSEIYTEDEKKAIETELERVDAALDVIEGVENAEELIGRLPENITMGDEDAVRAAAEAYDALSDHGKSLVSEAAKKKLAEAKALLAELKKPAQSYAPETGDDSPMALYMALLVLCGGAIVALTAAGRKRRKTAM